MRRFHLSRDLNEVREGEPCGFLREEHPRREELMQRFCGDRRVLGMFKEEQRDRCFWR